MGCCFSFPSSFHIAVTLSLGPFNNEVIFFPPSCWACSEQRAHKMKQCKWIIFAGHISPAYARCKTFFKKCWCNTCCCAQTQCYPLHVIVKYIQGETDLPKSSAETCIPMDPSRGLEKAKKQHCLRLSHRGLVLSVRMRTGSWKPFLRLGNSKEIVWNSFDPRDSKINNSRN